MAKPESSTAPSTPPRSPDPHRRGSGRQAAPEAYRSQAGRYTALFCAVHDVLQSPAALAHVFAHLRPGAAVAATGGKWPPTWNVVLRAWVADLHAPFISDFTGFDQPWRLLAGYLPDLQVTELGGGAGYVAVGHTRGPLDALPHSDTQQ